MEKNKNAPTPGRRRFLHVAGATASLILLGVPHAGLTADATKKLKIGIIGTGRIGGTLGELWTKAGHEVMFSSLELEHDKALAARAGGTARAGTPGEAAAFGEVLLISVPYGALPQVGRDFADSIKGKVVLETANPNPARDGEMANVAKARGTGVASSEFLPGARLVRAFNSVGFVALRSEAHRTGDKVAVPLAADDAGALQIAVRLVQDAGFEPVVVGGLARAKEFDTGTAVYNKALTAAELRRRLGLNP